MIGSPAEKRRIVGVTFAAPADVAALADTLRAYAGCWLVPTSGGVRLLPDADAAAAASYSHASGQIAALDALALKDLGNVPTVVDVVYTDTSQIPRRDRDRAGCGRRDDAALAAEHGAPARGAALQPGLPRGGRAAEQAAAQRPEHVARSVRRRHRARRGRHRHRHAPARAVGQAIPRDGRGHAGPREMAAAARRARPGGVLGRGHDHAD